MLIKPNLKHELTFAWHIALLKKVAMHHVAEDKSKTVFGFYIIIASVILGFIGQQLFPAFFKPTLMLSVSMAIVQLVSIVIGIYVLSLVAKKLFKGHAQHDQFFRVAAYGMIVTCISLIPQLSIVGAVWGLVIIFVALKTIHKLTTGGTIGTLLVTFVVMLILSTLLSPLYTRMGMGGWKMNGGIKYNGLDTSDISTKGFKMESGDSKVEVTDEGMKITTEDGETTEWKISTSE